MKTKTIQLYTIDELCNEAREKALNKLRENWFDYDWHEGILDEAKTIGALMGIDIDKIYFSGFWSQGDGACFECNYQYKKGALKAIKDYAPLDAELHSIAKNLQDIQKRYFYYLSASTEQRGHYYHEYCTCITVRNNAPWLYSSDVPEEVEESIKDYLRDFMRWIYSQLGIEFDYLNSDEVMIENCRSNEYFFDESGVLN